MSLVTAVHPVSTDAQLVFAGFAVLVATQQLVYAHWMRDLTARWLGAATAAMAVVLGSNVAVLRLSDSRMFETAMFTRAAALSVFACTSVYLCATLSGSRPPRWIVVAVATFAALRILLWPTTTLLYAHRLDQGGPVYGVLLPVLSLPLLGLCFAYLAVVIVRSGSNAELGALVISAAATTVIALPSFLLADKALVEQLTGWVSAPTLLASIYIVLRRQRVEAHGHRRMLGRQSALATLSRRGLTAPANQVAAEAEQLLREHQDADDGFTSAVTHVTECAVERRLADETSLHRATHDRLTGLPNRDLLRARLADALRQSSGRAAIVHIGVNGFRSINDSYGYGAGDAVLVALAERVAAGAPPHAMAARVDGDEFAVLAPAPVDERAASALAARLVAALSEPIDVPGFRGSVTVSAGVVVTEGLPPTDNPEAVLRDADIAMVRAKAPGAPGVVLFEASMRAEMLRRRAMELRLARAVADDEIVVHFEPVVSLRTGQVVACEALARWQVDGALLPPSHWIPIAESTGHIIAIGERVLGVASAQLEAWQGAGHDIRVAVNVSARQLLTPHLRRAVESALERGLQPRSVCLEVTESIAVDEAAVVELARLRDLGVLIALDDFGTGYSSLGSISRLPIDIVKIDRSFTARLGQRDGDALAATVLALADTLDLAVIAEGIETVAQANALASIGCPYGQGYLFGRAMRAEEVNLSAAPGWSHTESVGSDVKTPLTKPIRLRRNPA